MNHEKWLELAEIYATGALDGAEFSEFESHLASGCEFCRAHLLRAEDLLGNLASSYASVTPPASVKAHVMNQIEEKNPSAVSRPKPAISWAVVGIGIWAFSSLIVILSWNLSQSRKQLHELGVLMTSPETKVMEMKAMDPSPKALGRMLRQPAGHRCFFMAMGLEQIPQGKVYELWAIKGTDSVPMGTFKVDPHGCAMLNLSSYEGLDQFQKFAVTLEPSGGMPKPTGPLHLIGSL